MLVSLTVVQLVVKSQILAGGRGLGKFKNGFEGGVHIVKADKVEETAGNVDWIFFFFFVRTWFKGFLFWIISVSSWLFEIALLKDMLHSCCSIKMEKMFKCEMMCC